VSVSRYKTAGVVINRAAQELGLPVVADPFASSDPNMRQLVQHLNTLGLGLLDTYDWEHMMVSYSFVTAAGQTAYNLPADYHKMRDETQWDLTSKLPLQGPLTPQAWAQRQSLTAAPTTLEFRLTTNQLLLISGVAIPGGQTIAYEYKSRAWVRPAAAGLNNGNTLGTDGSDEIVQFGDYILFDPLVVHYGLKLLWRAGKQFATQANLGDFIRALDDAKGRAHGAKSLSLAPAFTQRREQTV